MKKAVAEKEGAVRRGVFCLFAQFVFNLGSLKTFLCWLHEANRKGEAGVKESRLEGVKKKPSIEGWEHLQQDEGGNPF